MKKIKYKGLEYDLNGEQEIKYSRKLGFFEDFGRLVAGVALGGLLISPFGAKDIYDYMKTRENKGNDGVYTEYLESKNEYDYLVELGSLRNNNCKISELEEGFDVIDNNLERLTVEAKGNLDLKKDIVKDRLDEYSIDGNKFMSFAIGASAFLGGSLYLIPNFMLYKRRKRKFFKENFSKLQ